MKAVRVGLIVAGTGVAAYGGWLCWPDLPTTAAWLIVGPVVHDAVVAPLIGLTGLALVRVLADRAGRSWISAGLAATATLLLIAAPLVLRPAPAPPNPGLQDRDYLPALAGWLAALWVGVVIGAVVARCRRRRVEPRPAPNQPVPEPVPEHEQLAERRLG